MICDENALCCKIVQYHGVLNGWTVPVFRTSIVTLTLISIFFLMIKIRQSHHSHISIYPNFVIFTCLTYLFVVICYVLGIDNSPGHSIDNQIFQIIYLLAICLQWWVQVAVVIFMMQKDAESASVRRTVWFTSIFVGLLTFFGAIGILPHVSSFDTITGIVVNSDSYNQFSTFDIGEIILNILFLFVIIISLYNKYRNTPAYKTLTNTRATKFFHLPRPAVFSDLLYYCLYAPLLWITLSADSNYWRRNGALLMSNDSTSEIENSGIAQLEYSDLVFGELVGIGGFAEVYKGTWKNSQVAIKRFKDKSKSMELLKEAKLMENLSHPNILKFIGIASNGYDVCIVTEYMSKGSLFDLIHNDEPEGQEDLMKLRKSWPLKLQIMQDIARGMQFLHSQQPVIIHRDLKSHNILLDSQFTAKICDFGVSRLKEKTQTMTQIGTPQWMSPEILLEDRYSEKVDVYSFGVLVWEIVTLKAPWENIHPLRVINMVANEKKTLSIPSQCPPSLRSLVLSCWNMDPNGRPSFEEILHTLSTIQDIS